MRRLSLFLSFLLLGPLLRAAEPVVRVEDPGGLLPAGSPWTQGLAGKLATFERTAGIRILLRLEPRSPSADEDKVPGAYMRAAAARFGVANRGVLMVYFADDPDWRVWVGDELAPRFAGRKGTAAELTENGAMHEAKEAFLKEALAQAGFTLAWLKQAAPKQEPPRGLKIALEADALVDGLIAKLAPR